MRYVLEGGERIYNVLIDMMYDDAKSRTFHFKDAIIKIDIIHDED